MGGYTSPGGAPGRPGEPRGGLGSLGITLGNLGEAEGSPGEHVGELRSCWEPLGWGGPRTTWKDSMGLHDWYMKSF